MTPNPVPLRAAVVGLGAMGRHHVRVYDELPDIDLVGVADIDARAVAQATRGRAARGYATVEELLERDCPDVASVAAPTQMHFELATRLIAHGVHVLVEKPIASTTAEAALLIAAARERGVGLMVGHVERFNPAVIELRRRLGQVGAIFKVSARRVGPFPDRIRDAGVVVDMATHDIDVMRFLLGSPAESVFASTARRVHATHEDLLVGAIEFAGGVVGSLDVNWLTPTKIRELSVLGARGAFHVNYLTQELVFFENGTASPLGWENLATFRGVTEGNAINYAIRRQEPLRAEIEAFARFARNGGCSPVSPEDAAETLRVAEGLIESGRGGMPVRLAGCADQRGLPPPPEAGEEGA